MNCINIVLKIGRFICVFVSGIANYILENRFRLIVMRIKLGFLMFFLFSFFSTSHADNVKNIGMISTQTEIPSVGHRPAPITPYGMRWFHENTFNWNNRNLTPVLGFGIIVDTSSDGSDLDNIYGGDEDTVLVRRISRVTADGLITIIDKQEVDKNGSPYYVIKQSDLGHRLKIEYWRESQSKSNNYTPVPSSTKPYEFISKPVHYPPVTGTAVLMTLKGDILKDNIMSVGDVAILRYTARDHLNNPIPDINQPTSYSNSVYRSEAPRHLGNGVYEQQVVGLGSGVADVVAPYGNYFIHRTEIRVK